jgi:hypothetical protein
MGRIWIVAVVTLLGACTAFDTPENYDRHRLSDITMPRDGGDNFFFDVSITAEFPDNDAAAEAVRMKWLAEWLEIRHMCPTSYEILKKRKFDYMEDNPAHRDLRYEARCKPGVTKPAPAG